MRIYIYLGLLTILLGCTSQIKDDSQIREFDKIQHDSIVQTTALRYNSLISDSILLDCKQKTSLSFKELTVAFGKPDSILNHKNTDDFYEDPYSLVRYENIEFRLFDNDTLEVHRLNFVDTSHRICYGSLTFREQTTMQELEFLFPISYASRDTIFREGKEYVALRFFTSERPTDTQWIMLFKDNRLKSLQYFDGND